MYSKKLQIRSTHSITYYSLIKYPIVKWFCSLHIHISFHLARLFVMDEILCTLHFQDVLEFLMINCLVDVYLGLIDQFRAIM